MESIIEIIKQYYLFFSRYIYVFIAIILFVQIKRLLLYRQEKSEILVMLDIGISNYRAPVTNYEISIGRSKACDITINFPSVSRQHCVLTMTDKGFWRIADTKSKGGILVNGEVPTEDTLIAVGDEVSLAGVPIVFSPATYMDARKYEKELADQQKGLIRKLKKRLDFLGKREGSYNKTIFYLNIFQAMLFFPLYESMDELYQHQGLICFVALMITPWLFKIIGKALNLQNLGAEAAAFFLMTIGFCMIASASPGSLIKQLICLYLGIIFYVVLCLILKNLSLIMKLRRYAAIGSIGLLLINLVLGSNFNGQTNWIVIGGVSIQPSEIVKVLFIFASSATLEWLLTTKNLRNLIIYAISCVGLLFLMGDFGTALIFFFSFIILTFLTTGDFKAITMTCITAALGAVMLVSFKPYIVNRFSTWRHVWEHIYDTGSQQARALIAAASGGLIGLGPNNGFGKDLFAADTDIVISMIMEQLGFIIAIVVMAIYILFILSAIRSHKIARSSYYIIASCAAASLFMFQAALNIFGTLDVLPFTGVTLPFVSNGGSSLIGSFGLLSFITASLNYAKPRKNKASTPVEFGGQS